MKKKNNKGFTLIELLAVVVILLAISTIAISSISAVIERNKIKQNETKKEVIKSYAKMYVDTHKNKCLTECRIYLSDLDLDDKEKRDADGNIFCGYINYSNNNYEFVIDNSDEYVIKYCMEE